MKKWCGKRKEDKKISNKRIQIMKNSRHEKIAREKFQNGEGKKLAKGFNKNSRKKIAGKNVRKNHQNQKENAFRDIEKVE